MGTAAFRRWLDAIGETIAASGVAAVGLPLAELVRVAHRAGVPVDTIDVLADGRAPEVARARAFNVVASALLAHGS